jgi:hypothetical protein
MRLIRQSGPVQRGEKHIAAAVTGENPPGAVASMGGGCQAQDEDASACWPKPGDWPPPVLLIAEGGPFLLRYLLSPGHQTRAGPASHYFGIKLS